MNTQNAWQRTLNEKIAEPLKRGGSMPENMVDCAEPKQKAKSPTSLGLFQASIWIEEVAVEKVKLPSNERLDNPKTFTRIGKKGICRNLYT
jgi:O-phosphoseryl-tRNA(Cys) synthetase